jgi:hypothetical protein
MDRTTLFFTLLTLLAGGGLASLGIRILVTGRLPRTWYGGKPAGGSRPNPVRSGIFALLLGSSIALPPLVRLLGLPKPVIAAFSILSIAGAVTAGVYIVRSPRA